MSSKRIHVAGNTTEKNNDIGHILINSTLFGTRRKKNAALKYVNKYLSSIEDFAYNHVDDIPFMEINSKLVGYVGTYLATRACYGKNNTLLMPESAKGYYSAFKSYLELKFVDHGVIPVFQKNTWTKFINALSVSKTKIH